jgi:hypothetical protein
MQITVPAELSWRQVMVSVGDLYYDNGTHLFFGFEQVGEFTYLLIRNQTVGAGTDSFEIALTLDVGSSAALHEQDESSSYTLVDHSPTHATFNLLQTPEVAA